MSLAETAIKNKTVTYFATLLLVVGGLFAYSGLGQLEELAGDGDGRTEPTNGRRAAMGGG